MFDAGTIVAMFVPSYRGQMTFDAARSLAMDAVAASSLGLRAYISNASMASIERSRNWAIDNARQNDARLLLMRDADVGSEPDALPRMLKSMVDTDAAVVGCAVALRDGKRANCEPYQPNDVYECHAVGTGLMLIDLRKLESLEMPWFKMDLADDGIGLTQSEDVYFCEQVRKHGQTVVCNSRIQTTHEHGDKLTLALQGASL